ncbi:MarR family winged helix-turn-helix transcriptional regulator [Catenovulum agarivorans]|uniref:MarR family winged helix-turn-helix transcriptional regulator n=1 Tax=Catenovulum agarivorans TaxID=1172192 RepID=UPI0002DAF3E9|nr:MarR family transcriptional regulator [Catenovulum agarivorans]
MTTKRESIQQMLTGIERKWPEITGTLNPTVLKMHRIHEHIQQGVSDLLKSYHLQIADFGVLSALRRSGQPYTLTPTELYQTMMFSSGGLTKVVNRVESLGLVIRVENPDDKRSKMVQLTEQGKQLVEEIMPKIHAIEKKPLKLTSSEVSQLELLLDKMLRQYEV